MTDYYGLADLPLKRSITEKLIEKYRSKLDQIEQGFDEHQQLSHNQCDEDSTAAAESLNQYRSRMKTPFLQDTEGLTSLWGLTKRYVKFKLTQFVYGFYGAEEPEDFTAREKVENLLIQKKTATSYKIWHEACEELDRLQKLDTWKNKKESTLYDYELIESNFNDLREARENHDVRRMLYLIRTTWTRNIGNIGNVNLFRHSHTGTKVLIEKYLRECELALNEITIENKDQDLDDRYILSMLVQTRKNIGRTALVLSGGGCFGLFHIGVLAALLEEDTLPRIISGSSAGSIVASILCVHTNEEISDLIETIVEKKFDIFDSDSEKDGFLTCLSRFFKYGTWYDSKNLQKTMIEFLGDLTFREAYNRTGRILNITVSPVGVHEHPRLLNYLTAPSVLIWSAVCASCSLPGIFQSSTIYEKNIKTGETQEWHHASVKFVDGSVDNDVPITRLSEMFNVDHIIACQVNPHVVPLLKLSVTCVGGEIETEYSAKLKTKLNQMYDFWVAEATHYLQMCAEMGIARNICTKMRSILSQQYSGDITILPDLFETTRLGKMLANPTPQYLLHCTMKGARSTWPKIAIIKNHCSIEFALDNAIKQLRIRNFKNLRSNNIALVNSPNFSTDNVVTPARTNNKRSRVDEISLAKQSSMNDFRVSQSLEQTPPRHHNRHRSETLNIGRLKQLRATKSNLSVKQNILLPPNVANSSSPPVVANPRQIPRNRSFKSSYTRFQRSWSASENAPPLNFNSQGMRDFSLPSSEAQSPLSFHAKDDYFKKSPPKSSPVKRNTAHSPEDSPTMSSPGIRKRNSSSSKSEDHSGGKKPLFANIDDLDGLFGSLESTRYDDDDEVDPIKVDGDMSPGSN